MEEQFFADMPAAPGTDLIIEHQEHRFIRNHERVVKKFRAMLYAEGVKEQPEELEMEIIDNPDEWEQAARETAARSEVAGRITDVIHRLVASKRPIDDFPKRAGPSETYHPPPAPVPARRDSSESDENDAESHAATSRKRKRPRNPFILDKAPEDDDESELDIDYNDYDEFM